MVDANIKPTEEVLAAFNEVKMGKTLRYAIFKIEEDKVSISSISFIIILSYFLF